MSSAKKEKDKGEKKNGKFVCNHRWTAILETCGVKKTDIVACINELEACS